MNDIAGCIQHHRTQYAVTVWVTCEFILDGIVDGIGV